MTGGWLPAPHTPERFVLVIVGLLGYVEALFLIGLLIFGFPDGIMFGMIAGAVTGIPVGSLGGWYLTRD